MIPSISVVSPAFNARAWVIRSLETVLAQTLPPTEVILSDDGSTDGTPDRVEELFRREGRSRRVVLRGAHLGPGAARNAGIRAANGEWIAFFDSDDLWRPDKLEVVARAIAAHPDANIVCHSEVHRRLDGSEGLLDYGARHDPDQAIGPQLFRANLFSTSALVCRRDVLVSAGLFDEHLRSAQDYEFWLRLAPRLRVHFIREPLGTYMDRPGNITLSAPFGRVINHGRAMIRHRALGGPRWPIYVALTVSRGLASAAVRQVRQRFQPVTSR